MNKIESEISMAVVPQDFLVKLQADINELKTILKDKKEFDFNSQWIESVKIPSLLGISKKTWQSYRDKRLIPFSQIGSKIYVRRADLEEFMQLHYIDVKGQY